MSDVVDLLSYAREKYLEYFPKLQQFKITTTAFINPEEGLLNPFKGFRVCEYLFLESLPDLRFVVNGFLKGLVLWSLPFFMKRTFANAKKTLAVGIFVASYRAFFRIAKKINFFEFSKDNELIQNLSNVSLGGIFASLILLTIDKSFLKNRLVVFWLLVRAVYTIFSEFDIPGANTMIQCLTVAVIIPTWIRNPQYVNRSYSSFLTWMAGVMQQDQIYVNTRETSTKHPCFMIHPHITCEKHVPVYFLDCAMRATRLYLPLHCILYLYRRIPLKDFAINLAKSIIFLSTYVVACWSSACYMSKLSPGLSAGKLLRFIWIAGLSLLFENSSRAREITLYTTTYSLDILYNKYQETRAGQSIILITIASFHLPRRSIFLFSIFVIFWNPKVLPNFFTRWLIGFERNHNKSKEDTINDGNSETENNNHNNKKIEEKGNNISDNLLEKTDSIYIR